MAPLAKRDNPTDRIRQEGASRLDEADRSHDSSLDDWIRDVAPGYAADFERLRGLLELLDRYHRETWQRHVAAGDAIVDRWDRARSLGFGEGSSIYDSALVIGDVHVGGNTWIGPNTVLDGSGGLTIGDWCSISVGVQIYSHDSIERAVSGGKAAIRRERTAIGSNTYVGPNAIVSRGVRIGERCIVGASSLVLADIADGSVAHGTPAVVVESTESYLTRHARADEGQTE